MIEHKGSLLSSDHSHRSFPGPNWRVFASIWVVGVLIIIGATFLDYGLTWDEEVQASYGNLVLRWYASWFRDGAALRYANLYLYGGLFDTLAQLAARVSPLGVYETRHLINALFGVFGIVGAYKLGSHLSGPLGGFFSAVFLTLTPVFYGHLFNNPKDVPFATLCLWAIYYLMLSYNALPRPPATLLVKLGITMGLALGVRVGGVLLVLYLAILWTGWLLVHMVRARSHTRTWLTDIPKIGGSFLLSILIAWGVMLVWWPWAQLSPLLHPLVALRKIAQFQWLGAVFFKGRFVLATAPPWDYLPTWFALVLPEFYFIALLAGCYLGGRWLTTRPKALAEIERLVKVGVLIFMFCFPIMTAILLGSTMYNGMRHFLFLIPLLAVLAGISFAGVLKAHGQRPLTYGIGGLVLLSMGLTAFDMVELHPYQSVYFNRVVAGGIQAGAGRFDADYWGNSYKEGAEWVIRHYYHHGPEKIRVASCSRPFLTGYFFGKTEYLRRTFVMVSPSDHPHLLLSTLPVMTLHPSKCTEIPEGTIVHTVQRKGTPLLYVMEVRKPLEVTTPEESE